MKKIIWLSMALGVVLLSVSACSFKKNEIKQIDVNQSATTSEKINPEKINQEEKIILRQEIITNELMKNCDGKTLSFEYPKSWGECHETEKGFIFRTDYKDYQVDLVLYLYPTTQTRFDEVRGTHINLLELTRTNDGEAYDYPQGGALMAGMIKLYGSYYDFSFHAQSNQPTPADLDGVWIPDNSIKNEMLLEIIRSIKLLNNQNDFKTYINKELGISFNYPKEWPEPVFVKNAVPTGGMFDVSGQWEIELGDLHKNSLEGADEYFASIRGVYTQSREDILKRIKADEKEGTAKLIAETDAYIVYNEAGIVGVKNILIFGSKTIKLQSLGGTLDFAIDSISDNISFN